MNLIAWLRSVGRQRISGWALIIFGAVYLLYFVRGRLFETGDPITPMEWISAVVAVAMIMMGTANIRLADMRDRLVAQQRQRAEQLRTQADAERKAARQQAIHKKNHKA